MGANLKKLWWGFGFPIVISFVLFGLFEVDDTGIGMYKFFLIAFIIYFSGMIGWQAIKEVN